MNRIALFLPNWIGDVVMATPAIRARSRAVSRCRPNGGLQTVCLGVAGWFSVVQRHHLARQKRPKRTATPRSYRAVAA